MRYRLGVDVGGTFTDLLRFDNETGNFWRHKTPSTPHDSSEGILNGVNAITAQAGVDPDEIEFFLHGTTVATNAVLEGKGARVGLITTEGYRDVMQIARSFVPGGLAAWIVWPKPQPLAALEDTVTVKGRMGADGEEVRPLDEAEVRAKLTRLRDAGVEAITVSLINAYVDGSHEKRVGEIAHEILQDVPVSLSHEVLPEMQEYERTLSTVANASVRPVVGKYVSNLRTKLHDAGVKGKLSLLRSDGGLMSSQKAEEHPVNILMSGPAGGVTGVLCALGDATTRMRTETARSFSRLATETDVEELVAILDEMARQTRAELTSDGIPESQISSEFEVDVRYAGQAFEVPLTIDQATLRDKGIAGILERFDEEHRRLFTFNMDTPHEIVNLRAVALGEAPQLPAAELEKGNGDQSVAKIRDHTLWMDGREQAAVIYDRTRLKQGDVIPGPDIVTEMDSTTLIESGCVATVDAVGNILINPVPA